MNNVVLYPDLYSKRKKNNSSNTQVLGAAIFSSHTTACLQVLGKSGILLAWFQENKFSPSKDISLNILAAATWMSFHFSSSPFPEGGQEPVLAMAEENIEINEKSFNSFN